MNKTLINLYHSDGHHKFMRKVIEELNELSCALSHYQDKKVTRLELYEEIADVHLQLKKLETYFQSILGDESYYQVVSNLIDKKFEDIEVRVSSR